MSGKVYLTGAGPGDAGLLTVKGQQAIKQADVILYDRLANESLLSRTGTETELIYVGKKARNHHYSQEEINNLLIEKASQGKVVTRLKGGDPFVFGRGGEEAAMLSSAGIEFEVIPGITSALSVPAYTGIPLTHRRLSSSFAVVTGHESPDKERSAVDWEQLASSVDTLVVLMGVGRLPVISRKLLEAGLSGKTPVTLIRWGTRPEQETIYGKLENIAARVEQANFKPPAVIVIGEVVSLGQQLNWFERKPLFGKKVVVTRPQKQAASFIKLLQGQGAKVLAQPTIRILPPKDFAELDTAINRLQSYDWLLFTSINGVEYFMERLFEQNRDLRALGGASVGVIGSATAAQLREYGIVADLIPDDYSSEGLLSSAEEYIQPGDRCLLPRADIAPQTLSSGLQERGARVDDITTYRNVKPDFTRDFCEQLLKEGVDMLTFTSSSTVNNFKDGLEQYCVQTGKTGIEDKFADIDVACIGPVTAKTARARGFSVEVIAEEYTINGLMSAIKDYYKSESGL